MSIWRRAVSESLTVAFAFAAFFALPARADLVVNGSFEDIGAATSSFAIGPTVLPDWSDDPTNLTGKLALFDCLVVGADATNICGTTGQLANQSLWALPGSSPDGGNFVAIDGDGPYNNPLTQTLTLPSAGTYNVSFYQAAAQLIPMTGATTDLWQVCLGTDCIDSTEMFNDSHSDVGWMSQTLTFNAPSTTEVLSFMAVGSMGLPPFVLLDGVSVTPGTIPEPAACTLVGIGLVAIPIARRLLKKKRVS